MPHEVPSEVKLYVKEQADRARNQAIGVLGFVLVVASLLGTFGVLGAAKDAAKSYVDQEIKSAIGPEILERTRAAATDTEHAKSQAEAALSHIKQLEKTLPDGLVRIEGGTLKVLQDKALASGDDIHDNRKADGHVKFKKPFANTPIVALGITALDLPGTAAKRLRVLVTNPQKDGFDYHVVTWGDSKIAELQADWLACGR